MTIAFIGKSKTFVNKTDQMSPDAYKALEDLTNNGKDYLFSKVSRRSS